MSTIKVDTVRPVTTDASLTLQGDSGGSGVSGITIDSSGNATFAQTISGGTIGSSVVFPALGNAASGTVSQTGGSAGDPGTGTPTGDIIEEGHSARGSYVKFANGTMICTNFASASVVLNTSYGNVYIGQDSASYNHPASFATITGAGHIVTSSSGGRAIVSTVTLSNTQITNVEYVHPTSQASLGITTEFIIYGTWY